MSRNRKAAKPLGVCVKTVQRFACPRCSEPVQPSNVHTKNVKTMDNIDAREVRLVCDCCNGKFRVPCRYQTALEQSGPAEEITDPVEIGSLVSFVNEQRVDIAVAG